MLIDSHCHLDFEEFSDFQPFFDRAKDNGVNAFVAIGASEGIKSSFKTLDIASRYSNIFPTVGIHPHDASIFDFNIETTLKELAKTESVVAIGETGLDYFYKYSTREQQIYAFEKQIEIANGNNLPVVIHTRDAWDDTFAILESAKRGMPKLKLLLHCYSGGVKEAERLLKMGAILSFSGIVTFKKSEEIQEAAIMTPLSSMLVETDSPFLAPIPFRGKKNEPAYVKYVAEKIAQLKNISFEEVEKKTTENSIEFFNLKLKNI
ncbi:TatD family hydrolase [bacterium]|nr:TatD family hydrolase [bacterium]